MMPESSVSNKTSHSPFKLIMEFIRELCAFFCCSKLGRLEEVVIRIPCVFQRIFGQKIEKFQEEFCGWGKLAVSSLVKWLESGALGVGSWMLGA